MIHRPSHPGAPLRWARVWVVANRAVPQQRPGPLRLLLTLSVLAGAALVAATAIIHLHLWLIGYRHIPRLGALFIAQAVSGLVLALALALTRHIVAVVAAAGYMAASAGGLILSATVGFVGIHDGLDVPWATWSLTIELVGFVLLAAAGAALVLRR